LANITSNVLVATGASGAGASCRNLFCVSLRFDFSRLRAALSIGNAEVNDSARLIDLFGPGVIAAQGYTEGDERATSSTIHTMLREGSSAIFFE
jgi:hypothetical protein